VPVTLGPNELTQKHWHPCERQWHWGPEFTSQKVMEFRQSMAGQHW
jgi:hypothetical protein